MFYFLYLEITIRVDESDCLSMASSHDQETERFLPTGPTGRRVSFNEAALFDHGKKTQEKGRRSDSHHIHGLTAFFFCFFLLLIVPSLLSQKRSQPSCIKTFYCVHFALVLV